MATAEFLAMVEAVLEGRGGPASLEWVLWGSAGGVEDAPRAGNGGGGPGEAEAPWVVALLELAADSDRLGGGRKVSTGFVF